MQNYAGGVLIISHDRFFLDRVANRIFEIENKTVTAYEGNYTYYMKVREQRRAAQLSAYEKQQEHIKKPKNISASIRPVLSPSRLEAGRAS